MQVEGSVAAYCDNNKIMKVLVENSLVFTVHPRFSIENARELVDDT